MSVNNPAFPVTDKQRYGQMPRGLTKREYAAIAAMQGILSSPKRLSYESANADKASIMAADALLAELAK